MFLLYDSGYIDRKRFIIYYTKHKVKFFIYINRVFYMAPYGFIQLVKIQILFFVRAIRFINVLIKDKSE